MFVENTVQKLSQETAYLGFTGKRSKDLDERFVPAERGKMDVVEYPSPIHSLDYIKKGLTKHGAVVCILICVLLLIIIASRKLVLTTLVILALVITLYTNS
jgi:hypothetical protein